MRQTVFLRANCFLNMFLDMGKEFWQIKHLTVKTTIVASTRVRVMVSHSLPIKLQRSAKLKILDWFYSSVYLADQAYIFCRKSIFSNCFDTIFQFFLLNCL